MKLIWLWLNLGFLWCMYRKLIRCKTSANMQLNLKQQNLQQNELEIKPVKLDLQLNLLLEILGQ